MLQKFLSTSFLLALSFLFTIAHSSIRLPAAVGDNMVLQQNSTTKIWGWADPAEKIYVTTSWNNKTDSVTTTRDAKWELPISTPAAGGPYTITLRGWNTIVLNNVMIGEVWICSGQSNMEWSSYNNLQQIIDELPHSANDNIRLFHIAKSTSSTLQDDCSASWKVSSPESLKGFSAVGYFFGKKLQQQLNVPIGLIAASWGGTPAEVWMPEDAVNGDALLKEAAAKQTQTPWWPYLPGASYNAMIYPVTKMAIAGAIWYQGESNTGTAATYSELLNKLIASWRKAWNKEFPFYYVQIAPYKYEYKNVGALLQEQQTKSLAFPSTGMVVITDLVDNIKDIHPTNKIDVANRLAQLALGDTYKKDVGIYKSPLLQNHEIIKDKIQLIFENAPEGFIVNVAKEKPSGFFIAGVDKVFYPADVKLEKNRIIVSSKRVKAPQAVRFGFGNTIISNVLSKGGLPITPFRTDNWEVDTSKEE